MQNLAPRIFNIIAYLIIAHVYNQFSSTSIPPITSLGFLFKKKKMFILDCVGHLLLCGLFSSCNKQGSSSVVVHNSSWLWLLLQSMGAGACGLQ